LLVTDGIFDRRVAPHYDESTADMFAPEVLRPTVEMLAHLANGGRALEFAVGTGRVAIPLSECGVSVVGIELSQAMVDQMSRKPGSGQIPVLIGDMSTVRAEGDFDLVYLVFNTITNLLTQDEQVDCFCNASEHLLPGGRFVIEVGVPRLRRLPAGETMLAFDATDGHFGIDEIDIVNQRSVSHHAWVQDGRGRTLDSTHRYAWPAEYDLMARIAGLRPVDRWADWNRSPFTAESVSHVSIWQKPAR
jgi:hypothetical protein